jgi:hypothetical protein
VLSLVVDEPEDGGVPQVFHGGGGGAIALEMPAIARRFHLVMFLPARVDSRVAFFKIALCTY